MRNSCPKCGLQAMSAKQKLLSRPHICQHCGIEVRMNLLRTFVVSILYYALVVWLQFHGMSGLSLLCLLLATLIFILACLYIPFEEKPHKAT